jgi:hypothetical protein
MMTREQRHNSERLLRSFQSGNACITAESDDALHSLEITRQTSIGDYTQTIRTFPTRSELLFEYAAAIAWINR